MTATIAGILIAIAAIFLSRMLQPWFSTKLFVATYLVAIAFIYVGFSLKENPTGLIVLEIAFAVALYFLALIGYTRNNALIAYGIILHGIWDIFHHKGIPIQTDIPGYWPTFCFIIDIIDGIYFLMYFRKQKTSRQPATQRASASYR